MECHSQKKPPRVTPLMRGTHQCFARHTQSDHSALKRVLECAEGHTSLTCEIILKSVPKTRRAR
eukprot:scaffold75204_cov24-Tisochrysis_lutea.AAC.1